MNGYEYGDGCYGKITSNTQKGAYLLLDNGQKAFGYDIANLPYGSTVLCTVQKVAEETKRMCTLVTIDAVIDYAT